MRSSGVSPPSFNSLASLLSEEQVAVIATAAYNLSKTLPSYAPKPLNVKKLLDKEIQVHVLRWSRSVKLLYVSLAVMTGLSPPRMYINILLDTVLATDVNKYSLASARCQPIWQTLVGELELFLAVALWDCRVLKPITTKHQSVFWLVSQSRRMSAICVGNCRWISLAAASADPVVTTHCLVLMRDWN